MSQFAPPSDLVQKTPGRAHHHYAGLVPAAIVAAGLYFGRPVLLPLAVAIVLAFALAPIVIQLRQLHLGRVFSVLIAAILALGVTVASGLFVGEQVIKLAGQLPLYQTNIATKIQALRGATIERGAIEKLNAMLNNLRAQTTGPALPGSSAATPATGQTPASVPVPVEVHQPQPAPLEFALVIVKPLLEPVFMAAIVFVFVVFILLSRSSRIGLGV